AEEIPSIERGTLDSAGRSVIWKLKRGVTWHDGHPFTADDVVFTWQFISRLGRRAASASDYANIAEVAKLDDLSVRISFKSPTLSWSAPFVGDHGLVLPSHLLSSASASEATQLPFLRHPIGTGPFKFVSFDPGKQVVAKI